MKHFAFATKDIGRGRVKGRVYRVRNNKLKPVTSFEFSYASTRGPIHEAYKAPIECGEIPRKWWSSSECAWMEPGYYSGKVTDVYDIQEIYF